MTTRTMHPDQQYIVALLKNDSAMINKIYRQSAGKIKTFVLRNSGSKEDAEEIFNDGLMKIYQKARKGDFILTCPFDYYLYMVCKSLWLNNLRKKGASGVTIQDIDGYSDIGEDVFQAVEEQEAELAKDELFKQKFLELGPACQNILKLALQKIPLKEVAEQLGNTYAYVRKKKGECTKRLIELVRATPEFGALNT